MRFLVITAFIAALASPVLASTFACGLKPLPPLGCRSDQAQCICDANGNCQWIFNCR